MTTVKHIHDVGSPDPEMNTSPIAAENSDDSETLRQEVPGEPVCYFNNQSFSNGSYIKTGSLLYKCDYGIWMPAGPADAENP